jgi:inosose dehydratase
MTKADFQTAASGLPQERLRIGSAPDSWGVWFPNDNRQLPWHQFLDELAEADYAWLELGPYGYLPTDPSQLNDEVGKRGLKVSGGTVFGALHRRDQWDECLATARSVATLTAGVGARNLVFIPPLFRDPKSGEFTEPPQLDNAGWKTLTASASEIGKILLADYNVRLQFHSHADSYVETQADIERFLDGTDPRYVSLCLDTGHVAYGGGDSVALIRNFPDRVGYVHIKQVNPAVLRDVRENNLSFGEAVTRGVCVEPPNGVPAVADVADALNAIDADVFVIVEQDLYPCDPDVPLPIAKRTRRLLRECGLGAEHQHPTRS